MGHSASTCCESEDTKVEIEVPPLSAPSQQAVEVEATHEGNPKRSSSSASFLSSTSSVGVVQAQRTAWISDRIEIIGGFDEEEPSRFGNPQEEIVKDTSSIDILNVNRNLTLQAAGHGGSSILKDFGGKQTDDGVPLFVLKVWNENEENNYKKLKELGDPMLLFVPAYRGQVTETSENGETMRYIRLSNLLTAFRRGPHVMDCKIGIRSFAESEAKNTATRSDLYKKMVQLDPDAPTPEEHQEQAVTKSRWMSFNDGFTSLAELGFRIDGIAYSGGKAPVQALKETRSTTKAADAILQYFIPPAAPGRRKGRESNAIRLAVAQSVLRDLNQMSMAMRESSWVKVNEFVGCSLLFIADANGPSAGVHLIDFAKLKEVPRGTTIDHRSPWILGNHEDGLFIGMDNMVETWNEVVRLLQKESSKH